VCIVPLVGTSLYVMTPEFGAASQLEKIDMLDFADFVAINKFDRKGRRRCAARRAASSTSATGVIINRRRTPCRYSAPWPRAHNDDGVTALYQAILPRLQEQA